MAQPDPIAEYELRRTERRLRRAVADLDATGRPATSRPSRSGPSANPGSGGSRWFTIPDPPPATP